MEDVLKYTGETVVVTGAAAGMGEKTAELLTQVGAKVIALDVNEPKLDFHEFISVNLNDKSSIDAAVEKIPDGILSIFNCAGVAGSTYMKNRFSDTDVLTINFIGARHFIEPLIPKMKNDGSVAIIASIAGAGWAAHRDVLMDILNTKSFDEAQEYLSEHLEDLLAPYRDGGPIPQYSASKELVTAWVKKKPRELSAQNIRINSVSPASVNTQMISDFNKLSGMDIMRLQASQNDRDAETSDIAKVLLFVNSDLASYVSGQDIIVDYGYSAHALYGMGD